jgi:hypothetical protein
MLGVLSAVSIVQDTADFWSVAFWRRHLRALLRVGRATCLQWLENRTEIGADCKAGILRLIWAVSIT